MRAVSILFSTHPTGKNDIWIEIEKCHPAYDLQIFFIRRKDCIGWGHVIRPSEENFIPGVLNDIERGIMKNIDLQIRSCRKESGKKTEYLRQLKNLKKNVSMHISEVKLKFIRDPDSAHVGPEIPDEGENNLPRLWSFLDVSELLRYGW